MDSKLAIFMLIIKLASATDYCCEFDSGICHWLNVNQELTWSWSNYTVPNVSQFDDFQKPDGCYIWLQEEYSGDHTGTIISPIIQVEENDQVYIRLYRHVSQSSLTDKQPILKFISQSSSIDVIYDFEEGWTDRNANCSESGARCCGTYPCAGYFELIGTVKSPAEMFAVDYFRINKCADTTTTPSTDTTTTSTDETTPSTDTTTPSTDTTITSISTTENPTTASTTTAIPNGFCGTFDDNTDGWTTDQWKWSQTSQPSHIPSWNSPYMWTDFIGGGLLISPIVHVTSGIAWSIDYFLYVDQPDIINKLTIYFQPLNSPYQYTLQLIWNPTSGWSHAKGTCSGSTQCCDEYPCDGQFYIGSAISDGVVAEYAVDNVSMGNGCSS